MTDNHLSFPFIKHTQIQTSPHDGNKSSKLNTQLYWHSSFPLSVYIKQQFTLKTSFHNGYKSSKFSRHIPFMTIINLQNLTLNFIHHSSLPLCSYKALIQTQTSFHGGYRFSKLGRYLFLPSFQAQTHLTSTHDGRIIITKLSNLLGFISLLSFLSNISDSSCSSNINYEFIVSALIKPTCTTYGFMDRLKPFLYFFLLSLLY